MLQGLNETMSLVKNSKRETITVINYTLMSHVECDWRAF
ncbi:unnamed protein product [Rhodiola kirilowii]